MPFIKLKSRILVLIRNDTEGPFDPVYIEPYRIVSIKGNQVEVMPPTAGKTKMVLITDVKYIPAAGSMTAKIPYYKDFYRETKLRFNPLHIPDEKWQLPMHINTKMTWAT